MIKTCSQHAAQGSKITVNHMILNMIQHYDDNQLILSSNLVLFLSCIHQLWPQGTGPPSFHGTCRIKIINSERMSSPKKHEDCAANKF